MDMLGGLLSGKRDEVDDFVRRYDQGAPWDGINDDEARDRYREVAPHLSDDDYEDSAHEAFSRLSPDQRRELGTSLRRRGSSGRSSGAWVEDLSDDRIDDPRALARATRRARQEEPNMLEQLLGGGGGGAAGGLGGGLLSNPVAKAALAGIAATAMKKVTGR